MLCTVERLIRTMWEMTEAGTAEPLLGDWGEALSIWPVPDQRSCVLNTVFGGPTKRPSEGLRSP